MKDQFKDKRITIASMDARAKRLAEWLADQGATVTLADERDAGDAADSLLDFLLSPVSFALGTPPAELLDETDLLCFSDGTLADLNLVEEANERNIPVRNALGIILDNSPSMVIGVTGSVGKTTTITLLDKMLQADGRTTYVSSDVRDDVLDNVSNITEKDVVLLELNSYALEISEYSPDISAILNVASTAEHDGSLRRYAGALSNIFRHQAGDDMVILNGDDLIASSFGENIPAFKGQFSARSMITDGAFMLGSRLTVVGNSSPASTAKVICERDELQVLGEHQTMNVLAACAIAGSVGVSIDAMRTAILDFTGVVHRLEVLDTINGVQWVNDSVATTPQRVAAALLGLNAPIVLLVGGEIHNHSWSELAGIALERCHAVITYGEQAEQIAHVINHARRGGGRIRRVRAVNTLEKAVKLAAQFADRGHTVLLSPGTEGNDSYANFEDRGEHFRKLVGDIKNQHRQL